jgi:TolB-like protein
LADAPYSPDASDGPNADDQVRPSVFLSYASEDREAARILRDALPGFGIEVWYDESELGGGEAWDQKIRRQIRECDYFMPIVSAQTQARLEGYFRREWRLAVERTLDMADDHLFLLPILIDDTDQGQARVPEKFFTVQWLKVPGGRPNRALESLCRRLTSGDAKQVTPVRTAKAAKAVARKIKPIVPPPQLPGFPVEEPGQRVRFWVEVFVWGCRSGWMLFNRLPKWLRVAAYFWLVIAFFSDVRSSRHEETSDISAAKMAKLKAISDNYHGSLNKKDVASLGAQIAKEFSDDSDDSDASTDAGPLLAVPFTAPPGDLAAEKLANAAFAMTYGMVSISHHGQVNLTKDPLPSRELGAALERGRSSHATYVLYGTVDTVDNAQRLTVKIATVADGSIVWSKSYPAEGADPAGIASEVDGKIPALPAK